MMAHSPPLVYYNFDVNRHIISESGNSKDFYCSICKCNYKYEYSLKRHVLRSHVNRSYIIHSDLVTFGITVDGHHERTEGDDMQYSCNSCLQLFKDADAIQAHVKEHHKVSIERGSMDNDNIVIKCPDCKAEFCNMRSLNCHMRYHKSASWSSNSKSSSSTTGLHPDSTLSNAHKPSIPTAQYCKSSAPAYANGTTPNDTDAATSSACDSTNNDALSSEQGRQLRQRSSAQLTSMFTCTLCRKTFVSYGSMLRHRKLSHDPTTKRKRPEISNIKRKTRKRSRFCDPKIARKYYNRVASEVAFNLKNCIHGNIEHIGVTRYYIQDDSKTDLTQLKPANISKKLMSKCNIKTKPVRSIAKCTHTMIAGTSTGNVSQLHDSNSHRQQQQQFTEECKSPDVYDKPGLWKFLCMVCLNYFPNTLELFTHQDTIHKGVVTTYMEVGKNYDLPLHAMGTSGPMGCITPTPDDAAICTPAKYTCTKCLQQFKTREELHPHLLHCGKELSAPLSEDVHAPTVQSLTVQPRTVQSPTSDRSVGEQTHRKKGRRSWQRRDYYPTVSQKKITEMNGFNVRKKKRNWLEKDAWKQRRVTDKDATQEEPVVKQESASSVTSQHIPSTKAVQPSIYVCPYCSISFRYRKPLQRHIDTKCETFRRISSAINPDLVIDSTDGTGAKRDVSKDIGVVNPTASAVGRDKLLEEGEENRPSIKPGRVVNTVCSPQRSIIQARALAKFCHPARACGPCFNCKRPNMARRYTHLQQRSDSFVKFVKSKCKNITLQSCICKVCESNFKSDYEKRKQRLDRVSGVKKSSVTRSKSYTSLTLKNVSTSSSSSHKKLSNASKHNLTTQSQVISPLKAKKPKSTTTRPAKPEGATLVKAKAEQKKFKPVQSKSLEQIFPEAIEVEEPSMSKSQTVAVSSTLANPAPAGKSKDFIPDIIDVEQEMCGRDNVEELAINPIVSDNTATPVQSTATSTIVDGMSQQTTSSLNTEKSEVGGKDGETRLQVILDFVKNSPVRRYSKVGRRSSLTDIIDAVTERVKEDPGLAHTLTQAINAAVTDTTGTDAITRQGRYKAKGARGSTSLPSILDGLVTKAKVPTAVVAPSTRTPIPVPCSIDLPPTNVTTTLAPPLQLIEGRLNSTCKPSASKSRSKNIVPKTSSRATTLQQSKVIRTNSDIAQSNSKLLYSSDAKDLPLDCDSLKPRIVTIAPPDTSSQVFQSQLPTTHCKDNSVSIPAFSEVVSGTHSSYVSLCMSMSTKRKGCDSVSVSSSNGPPKAKYIMTEKAYKHMVDIIDSVANGEIGPLSNGLLKEQTTEGSTEAFLHPTPKDCGLAVDSKDDLQVVRPLEQPNSPGSSSTGSTHNGSINPIKNLRLANIISKLTAAGHTDKIKAAVPASPVTTCSLNPSSIDSGFASMAE